MNLISFVYIDLAMVPLCVPLRMQLRHLHPHLVVLVDQSGVLFLLTTLLCNALAILVERWWCVWVGGDGGGVGDCVMVVVS